MRLLTGEDIVKLKDMFNGSINLLQPDLQPGEPMIFQPDELRLIAGALGTIVSGREVEAYVEMELQKWSGEPHRKAFLDELLSVVRRELDLLEFYTEKESQAVHPRPSHVKVCDPDKKQPPAEIPIEEFFARLQAISASSVFKR